MCLKPGCVFSDWLYLENTTMKKLLLILLLSPLLSFAQTDTARTTSHSVYCMLFAIPKTFGGNKATITVDYGMDNKDFSPGNYAKPAR
jgi:hypothetical protein